MKEQGTCQGQVAMSALSSASTSSSVASNANSRDSVRLILGAVTPEAAGNIIEPSPQGGGGGARAWARSWARRHSRGVQLAGFAPLLGVAGSCVLEFAMPGLLPFLCTDGDTVALFWLTALWNVSSIVGRLAASVHRLRWFAPANAMQALILIAAIICAADERVPPLALALPAVASFSSLHGLVVTSAFVAASQRGHEGTLYAGLANQAGALVGSLLTVVLVSTGAIRKK